MMAVQEADVPASELRLWDDGLQVRYGQLEHIGNSAVLNARIMQVVANDAVVLNTHQLDSELLALQQSGRWAGTALYYGDGTDVVVVANFYGLPDSSSNGTSKRSNEMLRKALSRAASFRSTPYILLGDLNVDPLDSNAVATAIGAGLMLDVV